MVACVPSFKDIEFQSTFHKLCTFVFYLFRLTKLRLTTLIRIKYRSVSRYAPNQLAPLKTFMHLIPEVKSLCRWLLNTPIINSFPQISSSLEQCNLCWKLLPKYKHILVITSTVQKHANSYREDVLYDVKRTEVIAHAFWSEE